MELAGKTTIVTGGGTGIGEAIALEFARAGADVAVCGRTVETITKVRDAITALGRRSLAVTADIRIREQVEKMVKTVITEFGHIDILVNNAGLNRPTPILDLTEETWNLIFETNLKGLFFCTQAVGRHMVQRKYGRIINITSTSSLGANEPGQAAYSSSKAGLNAFTKSTAREFGPHGITANAIAPGRILTALVYNTRTEPQKLADFIRGGTEGNVLGRIGTVDDVAYLALFLASDRASYITGEVIACNGGRTNLMGH